MIQSNIVINSNVLFDSDAYRLSELGMAHLRGVFDSFDFSQLNHVYIAGHTDSIGEESYNLQLSENRSKAVMEFMHNHYPVEKLEYKLKGFGESDPIESNNTEYGRMKNRRVEIILQKQ